MVKLIGKNKINTSVFISGNGTNLKNLIKFSKTYNSPIKINIVISNKKNAYGIRYAKKNKIKIKIIDFSKKREIIHLLKVLELNNIRLICLAGFLKILSKDFIKSFKGKIINIHPSLLPKYKGLNTHKRVLENNEKNTGCSVHFVNEKLDSGKIILQKKIKIFKKDNVKSLKKRVLKEEYKLYPKSIIKIFSNN
tara:strand:+ start:466 stop:1047 length:582 start_codon:yes stop_codon:yes gene_type:complete